MLTLALLALACPPPEPDYSRLPVSLDDVRSFQVDPECAYRMWIIALNHRPAVETAVRVSNPSEVVSAWMAECHWRAKVWCLMDDVLRIHTGDERAQLGKLRELLKLLGPEDYYGGRLPMPIPTYRMP